MNGRTVVHLPTGATIEDLKAQLDFKRPVITAVNGDHVEEEGHVLHDGDQASFFSIMGGGCPRAQIE